MYMKCVQEIRPDDDLMVFDRNLSLLDWQTVKGKGKGKGHPRRDHEDPDGE
jgi:hypothetical protein